MNPVQNRDYVMWIEILCENWGEIDISYIKLSNWLYRIMTVHICKTNI